MNKGVEIIPTVVPESFDDIVRVVETCKSFSTRIHVDVSDGIFAPNMTWMPREGDLLPAGMEYEIHLMVRDPRAVGLTYARAGAHTLIGHAEAFGTDIHAKDAFGAWRKEGIKAVATAALLQTPLESLAPYVSISDFILLMTIASIGVQGIPFEESGIERVMAFKGEHNEALIGVDGGVSEKNIERLALAGASHFCVGSALSKASDQAATYQRLHSLVNAV